MPLDIYTSHDLYRVMFDPRQTVPTSSWLDRFYPNTYRSTQEEILFDKINASRRIAPFMLPNLPGRPIYRREGERIYSFKPAYTKPKDAVRPVEMLAMGPGEIVERTGRMTPQGRFDAEVIRITQFHRNAITRLWEYMAARALIDGAITIRYQTDAATTPGHSVTIDFGRAAGHTITLGAGARWGDAGVSVFDNIQAWVDIVAAAEFGGNVTDVIMGAQAAAAFLADESIKEKLDTQYRGSEEVMIRRGLIRTDPLDPFTYLGTLGSGVSCWRVSGPGNTFQNDDGTFTNIIGPKEALLVSPGVDGVRAFGAILDHHAQLQVYDIFPKMFDQDDPPARFIMSQSAPLMIPVNPNATLKATVLA